MWPRFRRPKQLAWLSPGAVYLTQPALVSRSRPLEQAQLRDQHRVAVTALMVRALQLAFVEDASWGCDDRERAGLRMYPKPTQVSKIQPPHTLLTPEGLVERYVNSALAVCQY